MPSLLSRLANRFLCTLIVFAALSAISLAQETGNCTTHDVSSRPDCAGAIAFFQKLQAAVSSGNKNHLANMVRYPMRATQNGKRFQINNRRQFLQKYPQLFNPAVVCAIKSAKDSDVWGNYQGFMVGSGVIWWDAVIPPTSKNPHPDSGKYPFKIIAINSQNVIGQGCPKTK